LWCLVLCVQAAIQAEAERMHATFLSLVNKLLSNSGMDVGTFEDKVGLVMPSAQPWSSC
jgi:hypothetical protein